MSFVACQRFDYHPRGIHEYIQKIPGVNKNAKSHHVRKGETLSLIARSYGLNYLDVAKLNHLRKPYTIYEGQTLVIRGRIKSKTTSASSTRPSTHASSRNTKFKVIWPVQGRLSSKFGPRKNRMHDGIDIAAKLGTHVVSVADGEVVYAANKLTGYGKLIIIRHDNNMFTAYAHNNRIFVSVGDKVRKGQHISNVGATGRATGPHLHFEIRQEETPMDPLLYLPSR
ncbi:MAG: M23 family metallopeptidase [Ghiorsea sp.]